MVFNYILSIVDENNIIIGCGYNGFPRGIECFPWDREGPYLETKYPVLIIHIQYVCHAEMNAILNTNTANAKNCTV